MASGLNDAFINGQPTTDLAREVADLSTHRIGDEDRVVLGKWDGQDHGYIGEARQNGGIYFDTGDATWDAIRLGLGDAQERSLMWQVNEQFLRTQMENGVRRIEYALPEEFDSVEQVAAVQRRSFSALEINLPERECSGVRIPAARNGMGIRGRQLAMKPAELERFLEPTLSRTGFKLDEVHDAAIYGNRPAWAVYYRSQDCKLQICWSARDGGIDFMLASRDAPNEFGLANRSKKWHFMLMLSDAHDDLETPGLDADDGTVMFWLKSLFETHFDAARAALLSRG